MSTQDRFAGRLDSMGWAWTLTGWKGLQAKRSLRRLPRVAPTRLSHTRSTTWSSVRADWCFVTLADEASLPGRDQRWSLSAKIFLSGSLFRRRKPTIPSFIATDVRVILGARMHTESDTAPRPEAAVFNQEGTVKSSEPAAPPLAAPEHADLPAAPSDAPVGYADHPLSPRQVAFPKGRRPPGDCGSGLDGDKAFPFAQRRAPEPGGERTQEQVFALCKQKPPPVLRPAGLMSCPEPARISRGFRWCRPTRRRRRRRSRVPSPPAGRPGRRLLRPPTGGPRSRSGRGRRRSS